MLTHLPQHGDLEQLREEAALANGIPVELAAVQKLLKSSN